MKHNYTALLFTALLATACTSGGSGSGSNDSAGPGDGGGAGGGGETASTESLDALDTDSDGDGDMIVDLDSSVEDLFTSVFSRYSAVETAAGRIHILAQDGVDATRLMRARDILTQHLAPVAGTPEGATKSDVIQAMVNNSATLALFRNTAAVDLNNSDIANYFAAFPNSAVPLPADKIVVEGTSEYMQSRPAEDITFGATATLVHRAGLLSARPAYAARLASLASDRYADGSFVPPAELEAIYRTDAFLAIAMDVHNGAWGHDPDGTGLAGSAVTLAYTTREDLAAGDPATAAWINEFFSPDHSYQVSLPDGFSGNFDCLFRTATPYTSRSQYLRRIRLVGTTSAEIFGAPSDTVLTGNDGNNNLKGRAGDDLLIGGDGFDTAVFSGPMANYEITMNGDEIIVEDIHGGHDGRDTVQGFQRLQFTDQGINL